MILPEKLLSGRKLQTLVENKTTYGIEAAELHVFETHQTASSVLLTFEQPVLASMLQGKKVMHLNSMQSFDFLPGESLILPASEMMCIDFPEAELDSPTRCLAMTISEDKIRSIVQLLNETMPKTDGKSWQFTDYNFHFTNDIAIHQIIQRLLFLFAEGHPSKDIFADFMLRELIMRILQAETRKIYSEEMMKVSDDSRLADIIRYIRQNIEKPLTIQELSAKLFMSESNFYRIFKQELGISPIDFINNERIKMAVALLNDPRRKVKDIYTECGFNNLSYFTRLFKRKKNLSPSEYQRKITGR
jgi:AraC family transcriptional regulator